MKAIRKEGVRAEAIAAALFSLCISALITGAFSVVWYDVFPVYTEFAAGNTVWSAYPKTADVRLFLSLFVGIPLWMTLFFVWRRRHGGSVMSTKDKENGRNKNKNANKSNVMSISNKDSAESEGDNKIANKIMLTINAAVSILMGLSVATACRHILSVKFPTKTKELAVAYIALAIVLAAICLFVFLKGQKHGKLTFWLFRGVEILLSFQFLSYYRFQYLFGAGNAPMQLFFSRKWQLCCILLSVIFLGLGVYHIKKKTEGITLNLLLSVVSLRTYVLPEGIMSVDFFHNGEVSLPMEQLLLFGKLPYQGFDPIHGFCDYYFSLMNHLLFDGSYMAESAARTVGMLAFACIVAAALYLSVPDKNRAIVFLCAYLFLPYLTETASFRYLVCFTGFFILWKKSVREDARKFLFAWVLLCILAITWNVSIGAAFAVAFLPEAIYRFIFDFLPRLRTFPAWEKKEKRNFIVSYGLLVIFGISYIPLFLQILRFLSENTATTAVVNGEAVFGENFSPVRSFALFIPYLLTWLTAACNPQAIGAPGRKPLPSSKDEKKRGAKGISKGGIFEQLRDPIALLCFMMVLTNYVAVRYDEGLRLASIGVFFCVLYLCYTSFFGKTVLFSGVCVMVTAIVLGWSPNLLLTQNGVVEAIPKETEVEVAEEKELHPIVYVSGDSVDMPALGSGFVDALCLKSLQNVKYVLDAEQVGDSYLDMTNKLSHYVILEKESPLTFSSTYNISNEVLQASAIAQIKEAQPKLILISPNIVFDRAPASLRSFTLWQAIMEMGYMPCAYEDVTYLVLGESKLNPVELNTDEAGSEVVPNEAEEADNAVNPDEADEVKRALSTKGAVMLGRHLHKEHMDMLPVLWGSAYEHAWDTVERTEEVGSSVAIGNENATYTCKASSYPDENNYVNLPKGIGSDELAFILIRKEPDGAGAEDAKTGEDMTPDEKEAKERATVSFQSGVDRETYAFRFDLLDEKNEYVIPVASSPFWYYGAVQGFSVDGMGEYEVFFYAKEEKQ
ncbi:MAG: hypothetical protein K6G07_03935 [Lachnospiraceae bacterium]|nr:hypothetical protein [Lachnospiraceae bacterium]